MKLSPRGRVKRVILHALCAVGMDRFLMKRRSGYTLILALHRVSPHPNPFFAPLHPAAFEELVTFLLRHSHLRGFRDPPSLGEKPDVVLSFDDGYRDFVEYALPILDKHGIRANQNIIPSSIDSGLPAWDVLLKDRLQAAPRSRLAEIDLPCFRRRAVGAGDDGVARFSSALSRSLKRSPTLEREAYLEEIVTLLDDVPFKPTPMMTVAQVQECAKYHEVGAHSFSHEYMGSHSNGFFTDDFDRCQAWFRERLAQDVDIYAFPSGSYRAEQVDILRGRGVKHILVVDQQMIRSPSDVYPRLPITAVDAGEAKLRAAGFFARGTSVELDQGAGDSH